MYLVLGLTTRKITQRPEMQLKQFRYNILIFCSTMLLCRCSQNYENGEKIVMLTRDDGMGVLQNDQLQLDSH